MLSYLYKLLYNHYYNNIVYIYNIIFISFLYNKNLYDNKTKYISLCVLGMILIFSNNMYIYRYSCKYHELFLFFNNLLLILYLVLIILIKNNTTKNLKLLLSCILTINIILLMLININSFNFYKREQKLYKPKIYTNFHHRFID
jgi:hypothetical protein